MSENVYAKDTSILGLTNTLSVVVCAVQPCKLPLKQLGSWRFCGPPEFRWVFLCLPHCPSGPALYRNMGVDKTLWILSPSQYP